MSDTKKVSARASAKNAGKGASSGRGPGRPPKSQSGGDPAGSKPAGRKSKAPKSDKRVIDEIYAILFLAIGAFFVVAMQTKAAGTLGEWLQYGLKGLFGAIAYALPYCLIAYGLMVFLKKAAHINARTLCLFILLILVISTVNSARFLQADEMETVKFSLDFIKQSYLTGTLLESGGALGMVTGFGLKKLMGTMGLYITCIAVGLICILLLSNTPISQYLEDMKERRERKRLEEAAYEEEEEETDEDRRRQAAYEDAGREELAAKVMRKKQIMEYMADDDLFKEGQSSEEHLKEVEQKFNAAVAKKESLGFKLSDATKAFIFGRKQQPEIQETKKDVPMGLEEEPYIEGVFVEELTEDTDMIPMEAEGTAVDRITEAAPIAAFALNDDFEPAAPSAREQNEPEAEPIDTARQSAGGFQSRPYELPPVSLLNKPVQIQSKNPIDVSAKAALLEQTLKDFGVNAKISNVSKGPTVTRYEIQPGQGVKVSSIVRLSDDIALKLEARSIRMEAPIPGKAAVGIEIENDKVQPVRIREVIESQVFKKHPSKLCFAVGKDIMGNAVVADLAGMPHMLIAGSTGSGKSVCVNSIIASILYKASPEEVKLILVDPKVVELNVYNGVPHLLAPVVTDPGKAAAALYWAVREMDDRYIKFAEAGVRKLEDYNDKVRGTETEVLPQVVIIIDELADLMMTAAQAVEDHICRLAQKARAAGMHLIVATQRPSVDVITGLIKANIPSRIAFAVSSQIDSRTILDMAGAEKLVGKGDMLFNPLGVAKPLRVQGTFITDGEVEKIIEHVKAQMGEVPQAYSDDLIQTIETTKVNAGGAEEEADDLLGDAIEYVVKAEQASVSMLQRKFRIGYNRAARLVDMMEERGIVGPADGSRPRTVRMTSDALRRMNEQGEPDADIH